MYGDCVREIDSAIGDILSAVKAEGIDNETLVIFTSDNGAAMVSNIRSKKQKRHFAC